MKHKSIGLVILVGIGLAALFSLWAAPVSFLELLKQPLQSLWGSHQRILEVSENMEYVQDAAQRLVQPLGTVRLTGRFPNINPEPPATSNKHTSPAHPPAKNP